MENIQSNFIRDKIITDMNESSDSYKIITRFPPEPNGYLHIGHAKAICLSFGLADEFGGQCHLRFDDTNPSKEEQEFVDSIKEDIQWLGWDWGSSLYYASDYFDQLYDFAIKLIQKNLAYVDDQSHETIRDQRGTLTEAGINSPFRDRSIEENEALFQKMKNGEFPDGSRVLRAKIDMTSGNINLRDPILYRIMRSTHHRTGNNWCIYPMYDFAHGQSDSIEGITHSLCTMEFEDHRPLYDWIIDALGIHHPQQIEFARLNLSHTVLSKRRLNRLVTEGYVTGWDDPRMPTLSGLRRRGYSSESIRNFCEIIGIAKRQNTVDFSLLEHCIREDLNVNAPRVMGIIDPIKVIIDNYPSPQIEYLDAVNNPMKPELGTRKLPFGKELYIERSDFEENPPSKYYRLYLGNEVRLRYAYFITCVGFDKDDTTGEITAVHCTYDPDTKGGNAPDDRKVKGTIHWVSAKESIDVNVRKYDRLFNVENPDFDDDFLSSLNPNSFIEIQNSKVEINLKDEKIGFKCQFERNGYFVIDKDTTSSRLVFNQIVALRDSWNKKINQ
ncbi:MAG: glutamine--tRNA ligase [Chloroflexi bacterium]|nr:glutamine--tRNA ligase [Chloroflexota bacterium]|tara:strand:+ start:3635 stop:5299 length:1665 start_codon:yes stop_codon:yes gene_type:complete